MKSIFFERAAKYALKHVTMLVVCSVVFISLCSAKTPILMVQYPCHIFGGGVVYALECYKALLADGLNVHMLVGQGGTIVPCLEELGLPYTSFARRTIVHSMRKLCYAKGIKIIVISYPGYIPLAYEVAKDFSAKVVFINHLPVTEKHLRNSLPNLNRLDGYIAVNKKTASSLEKFVTKGLLKPIKITTIPPFFNENLFLNFSPPLTSKKEFFKKKYQIDIENEPIISAIGFIYANMNYKNYPLLIRAFKKVIEGHKIPAHLMIAGNGATSDKRRLMRLVKELNLQPYVHFLGFVSDIPSLLYNSDLHVLASNQESFGLVHVEAALMKKPSIGATNTGAEDIIIDGKTGLLFKNGQVQDLTDCIVRVLKNPEVAHKMGQVAHNHGLALFSNVSKFKRLKGLLTDLGA